MAVSPLHLRLLLTSITARKSKCSGLADSYFAALTTLTSHNSCPERLWRTHCLHSNTEMQGMLAYAQTVIAVFDTVAGNTVSGITL